MQYLGIVGAPSSPRGLYAGYGEKLPLRLSVQGFSTPPVTDSCKEDGSRMLTTKHTQSVEDQPTKC